MAAASRKPDMCGRTPKPSPATLHRPHSIEKDEGPGLGNASHIENPRQDAQCELGCSFQLTRPLAHFQPDAMSIMATPARVELRRSAGATVRDKRLRSGPMRPRRLARGYTIVPRSLLHHVPIALITIGIAISRVPESRDASSPTVNWLARF